MIQEKPSLNFTQTRCMLSRLSLSSLTITMPQTPQGCDASILNSSSKREETQASFNHPALFLVYPLILKRQVWIPLEWISLTQVLPSRHKETNLAPKLDSCIGKNKNMKEPKQAIDLLLSVLASYDTNVQKRQNSYQELFGVLRENVEEVNIAHHVGQNLWKCLQILTVDITNSDQSNPCLQKAFTILSFLVHNPIICPMFSPTQVKQFFSLLFNKINADKRSCVLAVWCLGAQQFQASQLAPYLRQIFESLNLALKNPFHSQNAVSEVIKTLSNLFNRISEDDILKYSEYWMIEIMKNALNPQLPYVLHSTLVVVILSIMY